MKAVKIVSLKEGDWITDYGKNFRDKQGKFAIGRVEVFKVVFDKVIRIDMDKKSLKEDKKDWGSAITLKNIEDENIMKLEKKDLRDFKKLETKLKILEGLEDERR